MSNLERKGKDATQCQKNQSHVFPRNDPGLQREETTTKRPESENMASIISHPLHVSRLCQNH